MDRVIMESYWNHRQSCVYGVGIIELFDNALVIIIIVDNFQIAGGYFVIKCEFYKVFCTII